MGEMIRKYFPVVKATDEDSFFITTATPDLEGDRVFPEGCEYDSYTANPLILYLHDAYGRTDSHGIPVGTSKALEIIPGQGIKVHGIDWTKPPRPPLIDWVESAWKQRKLRGASIGFVSLEGKPNAFGGKDHMKWKMLEWSIVPLPMNPMALHNSVDDRAMVLKALGLDVETPIERVPFIGKVSSVQTASNAASNTTVDVTTNGGSIFVPVNVTCEEPKPEKMGTSDFLAKVWDVSREKYEPARLEYGLVGRYLDCDVKDIHASGTFIPTPRIGSFLSAVEELIGEWRVEDIRNLTREGKEAPLEHAVVQLNSSLSRDFLIHGIRFMARPEQKLVIKIEPEWGGLGMTTYTTHDKSWISSQFIGRAWGRAAELNFLKGEAFSLSGEFLKRTASETWSDLFLDEQNETPLRRVVNTLNQRKAEAANRGLLLMGPPGTGKTLSGRIMMREAKATFIWVSAKDFYQSGAFGGIAYGFELARECAPSILFIEDVDNWLGPHSIDLLKTEMDGIGRSRGVVTILTTNYPERLPEALIDRPGRFHDVLQFSLPNETVRRRMLAQWLPDLTDEQSITAVKATDGYSGAHIRELANFVGVIREEESLDYGQALAKALDKLREQRELITAVQTSDSRYQPTKSVQEAVEKAMGRMVIMPIVHRMPMPDDMPENRRPMAEHTKAAHDHLTEACGSMAKAAATARGMGEGELADQMDECEKTMMGCAMDMAGLMKAMHGEPEPGEHDEPMPEDGDHGPTMPMRSARPHLTKEGRVLSQRNYDKLAQAHAVIGDVLDSAKRVPDPMSEDDAAAKTVDEVLQAIRDWGWTATVKCREP